MGNKGHDSFRAYFDFLRFCLEEDGKIPDNLNEIDWDKLYLFGKKQAIIGVLFYGIKKLPDSVPHPNRTQIFNGIVQVCL